MKKFLLFVLTLFGVTMVQGQDLELTLTVDQETVCEGTEVVFTLRLSEPRSGVFELYRGEDRVGQKQTDYSCDEMEFDPLQVFGSDENEFSACLRDDSVYFSSSVSIVVNQGYVGDDAVVLPPVTTHCNYEFGGEVLTESGDYEYVFETQFGCDSLVKLHLTIEPEIVDIQGKVVACAEANVDYSINVAPGQYDWMVEGGEIVGGTGNHITVNWFSTYENGTIHVDATSGDGCYFTGDLSVQITNAIVYEESVSTWCAYLFDGDWLVESGDYSKTYETSLGCDSTYILHLEILKDTDVKIYGDTVSCMFQEKEYQVDSEGYLCLWEVENGQIIEQLPDRVKVLWEDSGEYGTVSFTIGDDCFMSGSLTVRLVASQVFADTVQTSCSYYFGDRLLSVSGDYEYTFTTGLGCDSVVELHLEIIPEESMSIVGETEICMDGEAWYSVNPNENSNFVWTVENGEIVEDDTFRVKVRWGDWSERGFVKVMKQDSCFYTGILNVNLLPIVKEEDVNQIVTKRDGNGVPYILIYPKPKEDYEYQWYRNSSPIKGATGQYYVLEVPYKDNEYQVSLKLKGESCEVFTDFCVGQMTPQHNLTVYPNPSDGNTSLTVEKDTEGRARLFILSVDGRVVVEQQFDSQRTAINLNLQKGLYFLKVVDENNDVFIERIIIK